VLAKSCAFLDATANDVESRSSSTKSAASRATSTRPSTTAGVGRVHRRGVVDAVAEEPDDVPSSSARDDALLLVRIHLDEQVGVLRRVPERSSCSSSSCAPLSTRAHGMPRPSHVPGDGAGVAVINLMCTPGAELRDRVRHAALAGRERDEAVEFQLPLVVASVGGLQRHRSRSDGEHPDTASVHRPRGRAVRCSLRRRVQCGRARRAGGEDLLDGTLVMSRAPDASLPRRSALANEVVGISASFSFPRALPVSCRIASSSG